MPFISHHSKPPLDIIKIVGSSNIPMFNKIGANTQPNPHLIILDFHKRNRTNVVNKVIIYYSSVLKFSILKDLSARTELRYLAMKSFLQRSQSQ